MQCSSSSQREGLPTAISQKTFLSFNVIVAAMTALLVTGAVLQFRWITELKEAAEVRLGNRLQSAMRSWNQDFYRELSAICVALELGPDSGAHDSWDDYLQRYAEWRAHGDPESPENAYKNLDLVENVYIWETSRAPKSHLLRFRVDTNTLENSIASEGVRPLLERLQENSSSLLLALNAWRFPSPSSEVDSRSGEHLSSLHALRNNATSGWQFDANIPAIVHPILRSAVHGLSESRRAPGARHAVDWILVVLNLNTIQKRILPELIKRHFDDGNGLEYKLALIAVGPTPRLIYSSDSSFVDQRDDGFDLTMNVFGPSRERVDGRLRQEVGNSQNVRSEEWQRFAGPVWFPVVQYTSREEPWMLVLRRRKGSRQASVANLLRGSVVLLLLADAMSLLALMTLRTRKLAKLQPDSAKLHLDFIASASHELLTPLAALYSTGQNIRDGLIVGKPELRFHGSIITEQTRQLIDLVSEILRLASTDNKSDNYILQPLEVTEIIQCAVRNVAVLVEEKGFQIERRVPAGLPCVMSDPSALSRCLQNLIVNAIKYSGKKRWIGIYAALHEAEDRSQEVHISVHDLGVGIDSSELAHVFEPFYRSPSAIAAQIHGSGLGLAIARRVTEALGGELTVASELGGGSVFTLHLPVAHDSAAGREALAVVGDSEARDE